MGLQPPIDACVDELMQHAINDCDVTDLVTDALSQLFESVREAIGQEFEALLEGYDLMPTIIARRSWTIRTSRSRWWQCRCWLW